MHFAYLYFEFEFEFQFRFISHREFGISYFNFNVWFLDLKLFYFVSAFCDLVFRFRRLFLLNWDYCILYRLTAVDVAVGVFGFIFLFHVLSFYFYFLCILRISILNLNLSFVLFCIGNLESHILRISYFDFGVWFHVLKLFYFALAFCDLILYSDWQLWMWLLASLPPALPCPRLLPSPPFSQLSRLFLRLTTADAAVGIFAPCSALFSTFYPKNNCVVSKGLRRDILIAPSAIGSPDLCFRLS